MRITVISIYFITYTAINQEVAMDNDELICSEKIVDKEKVDKARKNLFPDTVTSKLAIFFKIFGDSTRLKILMALDVSELCVCDIMATLNMKQSTVSQQLKLLRDVKVVKCRQEGKQVFYSLDDCHIHKILSVGIEHIKEDKYE